MDRKIRSWLVTSGFALVWVGIHVLFFFIYIPRLEVMKFDLPWMYAHPWETASDIFCMIFVFPSVTECVRFFANRWYWKDSQYDTRGKVTNPITSYIKSFSFLFEIYNFEYNRENRFVQEIFEE